jgi:hypothetical protein
MAESLRIAVPLETKPNNNYPRTPPPKSNNGWEYDEHIPQVVPPLPLRLESITRSRTANNNNTNSITRDLRNTFKNM